MAERAAYRWAGVDVTAGERAVERFRATVESTWRPGVIGALGGFAGAVALPDGLVEPVLVSATDGVGTKTAIAAELGRLETIGIDLVAMCVDDVICAGAAPLAFLDYVAVGRLDPDRVATIVAGVAEGCRIAACSLIGGETAEHPGVMRPDEFDVSGCCIGVASRADLFDPTAVLAGDALIGLPSSGLHANGFSLVRTLVAEWDVDLGRPFQEQLRRSLGDGGDAAIAAEPEHALATIGDVLLTPTRIYAPLLPELRAVGVRGLAHITGGGLPANVPRMLPAGLGARLDPARWRMPSVMHLFGALGGIEPDELRSTFNGGLGLVAAVPGTTAAAALERLAPAGAVLVGEVVAVDELAGRRYAEDALRGPWDRPGPAGGVVAGE